MCGCVHFEKFRVFFQENKFNCNDLSRKSNPVRGRCRREMYSRRLWVSCKCTHVNACDSLRSVGMRLADVMARASGRDRCCYKRCETQKRRMLFAVSQMRLGGRKGARGLRAAASQPNPLNLSLFCALFIVE